MRLKLCACGGVVDEHKNDGCGRCGRGKKRAAKKTKEAGYGWDWQKLSQRFRKENPLCAECMKHGISTAAEEVHHIVPVSEAPWMRMQVSNLMALCVACHRKIDYERRSSSPVS